MLRPAQGQIRLPDFRILGCNLLPLTATHEELALDFKTHGRPSMNVCDLRADGFVEPCIPSRTPKPPSGPDWVQ
jgi:hypothetical protein